MNREQMGSELREDSEPGPFKIMSCRIITKLQGLIFRCKTVIRHLLWDSFLTDNDSYISALWTIKWSEDNEWKKVMTGLFKIASGFRDHLHPSRFPKHLAIAFVQSGFCRQEIELVLKMSSKWAHLVIQGRLYVF